jgi:hypothetical protein
MKKRCLCPTHEAFERYAGRGITICERWINSFENFLSDMGCRPEGTTLERIDNDKGYFPVNCEWATPKKQAANMRSNILLTIDGVTRTLPAWAAISGVRGTIIKQRHYFGWEDKLAVFTPSKANPPERKEARRRGISAARAVLAAKGNWKYGPRQVEAPCL